MPHALLLSPDDQAVNAITGVLEEMSVTCERPLDGASAAQKLNSQSFDLVLVDCENLPAAKLIFDVCRRGKNGNNPVPIAIVDGRAGLPTAFRLGAELILTKPVSKDQARTTIRTAVSRVRKDGPTSDSVPQAAAAAAAVGGSTQLTSFADPTPSFVLTQAPAAIAPPSTAQKMQSIVDAIEAAPISPKSTPRPPTLSPAPVLADSSFAPLVKTHSAPKFPTKPSDDPVLAELERTEQEESERAEAKPENSVLAKKTSDEPAAKSDAPVFSSYQQSRQKPRGALVAVLMLALAGGGFYAAWMYQPGFRALAQPQIDRVLDLAGKALQQTQVPSPAKPSAQPVPAPAMAAAPATSADPTKTPSTTPDSTTPSASSSPTGVATGSPTTSAATSAPVQPSATPVAAVVPPAALPAPTPAPFVSKPEPSKLSVAKTPVSKKVEAVAPAADAPLPGEGTAIILSSKGAEKRLAHSITPKYPADARASGAEGTIVLKEVVDENGKVEGVRLVEGNATLATAAMQAVKQWRYRPYVRDGKTQPFQTVVIVDFQKP
jgi:TonB family protein